MNTLQGKVAVITGGTRGLGFEIAQAYAAEGAAVVIGSRSQASVQAAVEKLQKNGYQADGMSCNVSDWEQVQALAELTEKRFNGLDIWVNNAGMGCPIGPTMYIAPESIRESIETNIIGVYHGSRTALQRFLRQGHGKLINMAGRGEKSPTPMFNPYGSSKSWVHSFTLALAKEHQSSGVDIILYNPGLIKSDMMAHMYFIDGYVEQNMRVFRIIAPLFAQEMSVAATKAVWLASSATDGKTGFRVTLLTPKTMMRGMGRELTRRVLRRPPPVYNAKITIVSPADDFPPPPVPGELNARQLKKIMPDETNYIVSLLDKKLPATIGNKAMNLRLLQEKRFQIPKTYICTWDAYLDYLEQGEPVLQALENELQSLIEPGKSYAIRSSANIEDSLEYSFAGQFTTILNANGIPQILNAIRQIWQDAKSDIVQAYVHRTFSESRDIRMAVIIQEMIIPVLSGVAFSKNPITTLDEVIVEAVPGTGDNLVQAGITPLRWVNKWGNWINLPDAEELENIPVTLETIGEVVAQTKTIARTFKKEVDLEWVFDGQKIWWVQFRDITSIREITFYSNRMAKEMTPGLVKPLVWSVTTPNPSHAWADLLSEVTGKNNLDPNKLLRQIHYRAYHNMALFGQIFESLGLPRESLEMMLGILPPGAGKPPMKPSGRTFRLLPRLGRFAFDKWRFADKLEQNYNGLHTQARAFPRPLPADFDDQQIIHQIDQVQLLNRKLTYFTIVGILLMQIYSGLLRRQLKKQGIDFQHFELIEGLDEIKAYDPATYMEALHLSYLQLDTEAQSAVQSGNIQALEAMPNGQAFNQQFIDFMNTFGHLSDTTGHFGSVPWRETPKLILDLIVNYQKPEQPINQTSYNDLAARPMMLRLFYNRARQFRLFREKYSSLYSYTLMLFRDYYLALGDRLVQRGFLEDRLDILYLYDQEVRAYIAGNFDGNKFSDLVVQRKEEMEQCKDAILPEVIFGDNAPLIINKTADRLTGTPTSKGYHTGPTRIVRGVGDFHKVESGDVLVIPFSDVSWTPLFARAGAVVSESGGILSHSSIIAREYNIPAVVSVSRALLLPDGVLVTVDGYKGEILVHETTPVQLTSMQPDEKII